MDHLFDEFSKSLAESVPRRESLRRMGAVFAGAVLSPLAIGTAWAGRKPSVDPDPCKAFCNCPRKQQDQCLAACRACGSNISRLAGRCGSYVCCPVAGCGNVCSDLASDPNCGLCGNNCSAFGQTCCDYHCTDLAEDFYNCGSCGNVCDEARLNEFGACVAGTCVYDCFEGATDCNGDCAFLESDPDHCGGCGNVCPGWAPWCVQGECMPCPAGREPCGDLCVDLNFDPNNCGACGNVCGADTPFCEDGTCTWCGGDFALCDGECVYLLGNALHCGACGHACDIEEQCNNGSCVATCSGC